MPLNSVKNCVFKERIINKDKYDKGERAFQIERPIGKGPAPGRAAPHAVQCWVTRIPAAKSTPHQCPEKTGKRPDHHRRRQSRQAMHKQPGHRRMF